MSRRARWTFWDRALPEFFCGATLSLGFLRLARGSLARGSFMRSGGSMLSQTPTGAGEDLVKPVLVMLNGTWDYSRVGGKEARSM